MAYSTNMQTIYSDSKRAIRRFTLNWEDDPAPNATEVLLNASTFGWTNCKILKITQFISGGLLGMLYWLYWHADTNVLILGQAVNEGSGASTQKNIDFRSFGGITNNAGAGVTGNILIKYLGLSILPPKRGSIDIIIEVEGN